MQTGMMKVQFRHHAWVLKELLHKYSILSEAQVGGAQEVSHGPVVSLLGMLCIGDNCVQRPFIVVVVNIAAVVVVIQLVCANVVEVIVVVVLLPCAIGAGGRPVLPPSLPPPLLLVNATTITILPLLGLVLVLSFERFMD
jgi:hypothetical protein